MHTATHKQVEIGTWLILRHSVFMTGTIVHSYFERVGMRVYTIRTLLGEEMDLTERYVKGLLDRNKG